MIDIDDYINSLIKENEHLKTIIESLKNEIKILEKKRPNISSYKELDKVV